MSDFDDMRHEGCLVTVAIAAAYRHTCQPRAGFQHAHAANEVHMPAPILVEEQTAGAVQHPLVGAGVSENGTQGHD